MAGSHGSVGGGKAEEYLSAAPVPSPAGTASIAALPSNKFEISSYELSKPGQADQASDTYTRQLIKALRARQGWVSEVLPSDADMSKTEIDCQGQESILRRSRGYGDDWGRQNAPHA